VVNTNMIVNIIFQYVCGWMGIGEDALDWVYRIAVVCSRSLCGEYEYDCKHYISVCMWVGAQMREPFPWEEARFKNMQLPFGYSINTLFELMDKVA